MSEEELAAYALAIRPFRRTEDAMGGFFSSSHFVTVLRGHGPAWLELLRLMGADFARAWEGRRPACCEDPTCCFDLESRSAYAALFAIEFASLGASIEEAVKMTLDLHDALDRQHHVLVEPVEGAEIHFQAVHPERVQPRTAA